MDRKFVVFKVEDILEARMDEVVRAVSDNIVESRAKRGKGSDNQYLVINRDEPYAEEIIEILKRNGHWG